MNLIYYIFLLLIIFLLVLLSKKNEKLSPKKIRRYMNIVIMLFLLRYIGLFLLCIVKSGEYIFLFKGVIYLNSLAIPLIVLALDYVYLRWDKLSFSINYFIAIFLVIGYITSMFFINEKIIFNVDYGYLINIKNELVLYLGTLIVEGALLLYSIYYVDKPNNNRKGIWYVIIALTIVITENVLFLGGIRLFPYPIIADGIFVLLMNLGLDTFK